MSPRSAPGRRRLYAAGMPFGLGIGPWELIALAVVIALVFGPSRVPTIARSLGGGLRHVQAPLDEVKNILTLEAARTAMADDAEQTQQGQPQLGQPPQGQPPQGQPHPPPPPGQPGR
jgi:sec-independent protein translocase protein TatA